MIPSASPPCMPRELVANPVFLLARLGFGVKKHAIEELERIGSSLYDYSVLALLAEAPCEGQSSIAEMLSLDKSQLVGLLDGLEERKLIERRRDPNDRRRHNVLLTAEGKRQLEKLRELVNGIAEEFLAPLTPAQREELHKLLLQVAGHHDARYVLREEGAAA
jgi:MarR family transcriptional regulator, lower aerobic nicotinate degradation pathway regulator